MLLLQSNFCQSCFGRSFGQIFCQSFLLKRDSVDLCLFCSKSAHGLRTRSNSTIHHIYPIFWYHAKQNPAVIGKGHGRRSKRAPHSLHDLVQWCHEQWQQDNGHGEHELHAKEPESITTEVQQSALQEDSWQMCDVAELKFCSVFVAKIKGAVPVGHSGMAYATRWVWAKECHGISGHYGKVVSSTI